MTHTSFAWIPQTEQKAPPSGHPDDKYLAPEGTYKVEISHAEERVTKKGDGKYLRVSFSIVEPKKYSNKLVFLSYTTENPNEMAMKIGIGELQKLCEKTLGFLPEANVDTIIDQLIGKQVNITLAHKEGAKRDDGTLWPKSYIAKKYEAVDKPADSSRKAVYQTLTGVSAASAVMGQRNTQGADPELDDALPF